MDGVAKQHSARCPLASKPRLPIRLHVRATPRQSATPVLSKAPSSRAASSNTFSCDTSRKSQQHVKNVACSAVAPSSAAAAAPAQIDNVPRGETAGANLILENATVQAGHRDLLEVSRTRGLLPHIKCKTLVIKDNCKAHSAYISVKASSVQATSQQVPGKLYGNDSSKKLVMKPALQSACSCTHAALSSSKATS